MHLLAASWLALIALASSPAGASSPGFAPPDFAPLARLVQEAKDATLPSGTAIAVVKDGEIVHEAYFGYADIAARVPVSRDTGFYVASATKPVFALHALLQAQAGRLDMRTTLRDMFPAARFDGLDAGAVTAEDLLTHVSGIDNAPLVWATAFSGVHDAASREALVAASYPDADAAHGTFRYTNVGYNILSVWMDRQGGRPWQAQLEDDVLRPLGMARTSASIARAEAAGWPLARPYSFAVERPDAPLYLAKSDDTMHAAGGLVSTAPDLAAFLAAQLAPAAQPRLAAAIARSHAPRARLSSQYLDFARSGYAWGWYTGEYKGRTMLHHFGGFAGFHAHLSFVPEAGVGLVVLNNEDVLSARLTNLIADYVYGAMLGEPGVEERAAERFAALRAQGPELRRAVAAQREKIRARAWRLSRPREDYAGVYAHPLLGEMTVALDPGGGLALRWGRLAAVATAGEAVDQVRAEFAPGSGEFLGFAVRDGAVGAVSLGPMTFVRVRESAP
ncbi:serine hydrolase [Luteimonas sp. Y-2-2-4F]|nr:serine hydrolase [Luteimonas sp. Y-2-2-4F]MCD9030470.1 serine hydrolase [Luteimonas sp. Y-2-2-4F]